MRRRFPTRSPCAEYIRANLSSTIATGSDVSLSEDVNARPLRIGIPIAAKYPGRRAPQPRDLLLFLPNTFNQEWSTLAIATERHDLTQLDRLHAGNSAHALA